MNSVADAWRALRAEGRAEQGWHVRRIYEAACCDLHAGVLQPGAIPGLLVELGLDDVPAGLVLPQSRGFSVAPSIARPGARGRARFSLQLTSADYETVFTVLCADAAQTAAAAGTPRAALRAWIDRLHVWQEFMSRHGAGGLSDQEATGLYGELWFMRERLVPLIGIAHAVDAWAGPSGEPNDFVLAAGYVEVKATIRQAPQTIEISDADQLDTSRGAIFLAHLLLQSDAQAETLAQLVASIRSAVVATAPERLQRFNDLLLQAGYVEAQSPIYDQPWRVRDLELYAVDAGFPRIMRNELRVGVRDCRYSIDRAACAGNAVADQALEGILGR